VRIKRGGPFMHLKAYAIDGKVLRTGSANFSASGENAQDNDLIVIRDAGAARALSGTVKANQYRRFSASNLAERADDS